MSKFCTKCGQKLDEKTGLCPNCDKPIIKKEKKRIKKNNRKELSFGQKVKKISIRILTVIIAISILSCGAAGALVYFDIVDIPVINTIFDFFGIKNDEIKTGEEAEPSGDTSQMGQYTVEQPDADAYFQNNSTILNATDANNSDLILSEDEAYNLLNERGFTEYPIITEYSMNGDYIDEMKISQGSSERHPIYQTNHICNNGDVWNVYIIGKTVIAMPVSYNAKSSSEALIVITENDSMMSYDTGTNRFYETIPNESIMVIKKVDCVDAMTLENLDAGAINAL